MRWIIFDVWRKEGIHMSKRTDLRIQKTQLLIRNAFLDLIDEKGFTSMTVQNIADKAMIGRGTFYLHYKDKYDLMDQLIEFNLNRLSEIIQPSFHFSENKLNVSELRKMLILVFEYIQGEHFFFKIMLSNRDTPNFNKELTSFFFEKFIAEYDKLNVVQKKEIPKGVLISYLSSSILGVIVWWLQSDMIYTPSYMAECIIDLLIEGPKSMLEIDYE